MIGGIESPRIHRSESDTVGDIAMSMRAIIIIVIIAIILAFFFDDDHCLDNRRMDPEDYWDCIESLDSSSEIPRPEWK